MNTITRFRQVQVWCVCSVFVLGCLGATIAAAVPDSGKAPIYKVGADGEADVQAALAKAKEEHKRVLIQYGANWCGWCRLLHGLFESNADIRKVLDSNYVVVLVNTDDNKAVATKRHTQIQGIPFLTVLDANGTKLVDQPTDPLEEGDHHNPAKVLDFLNKWKAPATDAKVLFNEAKAEAAKEKKLIFVHFGAQWCGWCRRLDALLDDPAFSKTFDKQYIHLKIDVDTMHDGKSLQNAIGPKHGGGIPWYAVVNAEGKTLATSDDSDGNNTGYPMRDAEVTHFMGVLKSTATKLDTSDLDKLAAALKAQNVAFQKGFGN